MIDEALLSQVDARLAKLRQPATEEPIVDEAAPPQPEATEEETPEGPLPEWGLEGPVGVLNAVGTGVVDAGFQAKDFFTGEPADEDKSEFRLQNEAAKTQLRDSGLVNNLVMDISQFTAGLVGVGKIMAPIKGGGAVARGAWEIARGAAAGFLVMDPHEERLSNLLVQYEPLRNPVTEYLAAGPNDSATEGRLKNALEGIGMDLAMVGIFELGLKAIKSMRAGDEAGAQQALKQAEELQTKFDADRAAREAIEGTPANELDEAFPARAPSDDMARPTAERQVADVEVAPQARPEAGTIEPVKSEAAAVPMRPKDQGYTPTVEVPETSVKTIVTTARQDAEAAARFGSREAAVSAGAIARGVDLPWQKINSTDDVEALVASTTREIQSQMDAAKGGSVLTDAKVHQMIQSAARHWGADPSVVMGEIVKSGERSTHMVADLEASFIISQKLFEDSYTLATKIRTGMLDDFGGDVTKAHAELARRLTAAADMMAQGSAMRAAFGRGLRRMRSQFAIKPEDIAKFKDMPPDRLADIVSQSGGDIEKLKEVVKPSFGRRIIDEGTFLLTNNLLWNWTTHAVNTSTNLYMLVARPTEKLIGSLVQGGRGSAIRRQAMKEYAYTLYSVSDAWHGLVDAFMRADSVIAPHGNEYTGSGSRVTQPAIGWKPIKSTWDLFANGLMSLDAGKMGQAAGSAAKATYRTGVGLPTRSLGAVDEFINQLRYRSVVQARASVEGTDAGLTGVALKNHIEDRLAQAFDAQGRAVDNAALLESRTTTFQQDLLDGTLGKAIQNVRHNWPAASFILPFVKTPVNVLRYATKMTPGLNLLQKEYRQMLGGKLGSEAQAHAIGQMALGSFFMATAANLALSGKITGSGPTDPALKKQLQATGWMPYSLVYEDEEGHKTYFPLGRFDPVGMPFGMVADVVDMMVLHPENRKGGDSIMAIGVALASSFSEKTFLMNLNQVIQALANPGEGGENIGKYVGNLSSNMIPGSSGIRNYFNGDEYLREARTFMDRTMAGLPGYSDKLPPQRDSFGEPIWRKRALTTGGKEDAVEAEHNRIILETGYGVRPPTPHMSGVDLRTVTLSDGRNAYDVYQEMAATGPKSLKDQLASLISSNGYQRLVDGDPANPGTKIGAIMDVVNAYRQRGKAQMLKDYPELRQMLSQGAMDHRTKLQANQKNQQSRPSVRDLLSSMGY